MKRTDGAGMHNVLSYALALYLAFPVAALAQQQPSTVDPGRLRERFDRAAAAAAQERVRRALAGFSQGDTRHAQGGPHRE